MPVVAALELQDRVQTGEPSGQADRAHRGLGPARDQPDHLDRGECVHDHLGQSDLGLGRSPERGPSASRGDGRLDDLGAGVPEKVRTP
jgi:hypothetical protein